MCLWQGSLNTITQQDNARPDVARRTFISLTRFDILPWAVNSPDLNLIKHLWDPIGCDIDKEPVAQTVDDLHTAGEVACQRSARATINGPMNIML
ncbi:hypothetical protein TNCV_2929741 [Trichonephila clavipes]|nr:hypothetical protein TNCV_2929741 [Trichonephila clavipes]